MIWTNWARNVSVTPVRQEQPASEDELSDAVRRAVKDGHTVRVVGGGHSFCRRRPRRAYSSTWIA